MFHVASSQPQTAGLRSKSMHFRNALVMTSALEPRRLERITVNSGNNRLLGRSCLTTAL